MKDELDTFDRLISDIRDVERSGDVVFEPPLSVRLGALLAAMEPFLMPVYGKTLGLGPEPDDESPIYTEVLGSEPAPGSDWALIEPVKLDHLGPPAGSSAEEIREWYDTHNTVTGELIEPRVTGNTSGAADAP